MRRLALAVGLGLALAAATAAAAPLAIRHARTIRVALTGDKSEEAIALRAGPGGWRLELAPSTTGTLVFRDVTAKVVGPRFELPLAGGSALLDDGRFRADHAYRVELRRGTVVVGGALVYLSPPRKSRGPVVFDDGDAARPDGDDELRPSDKGAL